MKPWIVGLLLYPLLLVSCNSHSHSTSVSKYVYPYGVWHSGSGHEITVAKNRYKICFEGECETGEIYYHWPSYYLVDFKNLSIGKELITKSMAYKPAIVPEGADPDKLKFSIEFYPNREGEFAKQFCYNRPCYGFGNTHNKLYSFHWHESLGE